MLRCIQIVRTGKTKKRFSRSGSISQAVPKIFSGNLRVKEKQVKVLYELVTVRSRKRPQHSEYRGCCLKVTAAKAVGRLASPHNLQVRKPAVWMKMTRGKAPVQVTSNLPDHEILTVSLIIQTERLSVFLVNLQLPSGQERVVFLCQRRSKETENGEKEVLDGSMMQWFGCRHCSCRLRTGGYKRKY